MRLWILSDFHLDIDTNWDLAPLRERPHHDVMVVAGDVCPRMERGVAWLAERVTDREVVFVPGNHEFHGTDIDRTVDKARRAAAGTNIHVLQDESRMIGGVTFVCSTFWTDFMLFGDPTKAMAVAGMSMCDYRRIRCNRYRDRLRPRDTLERNRRSRAFIAEAAATARNGRVVAVTHHAPTPRALPEGTECDLLSAAYANGDCPELLQNIDTWVFGHTHETREFVERGTRFVTNAKGYGRVAGKADNPRFDPNFTVQI